MEAANDWRGRGTNTEGRGGGMQVEVSLPAGRTSSSSSGIIHSSLSVSSLQNLAVKTIVKMLFAGAEGGEEHYLQVSRSGSFD